MKAKVLTFLFIIFLNLNGAFATPALRVISLSPALTEMIYALKMGDLLVGVSDFSDYPKAAKTKPSVGAYTKPNLEKIISLKPDLIFVPLEGPEDVKQHLDQLHLRYKVIKMRTLKDVGDAALKIGEALGVSSQGLDFKISWDKTLKDLFQHSGSVEKSVFIEVQKDPLIAVGPETFLDEIVTGCGGHNVVKEKGYPRLSLEFIAQNIADVVLLADYFSSPKEKDETVAWWKNRSHGPKEVIPLDNDTTSRPGPRLIEGIKLICSQLRVKK